MSTFDDSSTIAFNTIKSCNLSIKSYITFSNIVDLEVD